MYSHVICMCCGFTFVAINSIWLNMYYVFTLLLAYHNQPSACLCLVFQPSLLGEPPEQRWSHIGPSGYTTQYMTRVNRQGKLERLMQWMEAKTSRNLPMQLARMLARAREQVFWYPFCLPSLVACTSLSLVYNRRMCTPSS
jgi:hypothetical protein